MPPQEVRIGFHSTTHEQELHKGVFEFPGCEIPGNNVEPVNNLRAHEIWKIDLPSSTHRHSTFPSHDVAHSWFKVRLRFPPRVVLGRTSVKIPVEMSRSHHAGNPITYEVVEAKTLGSLTRRADTDAVSRIGF